jgi:hypothetical protein
VLGVNRHSERNLLCNYNSQNVADRLIAANAQRFEKPHAKETEETGKEATFSSPSMGSTLKRTNASAATLTQRPRSKQALAKTPSETQLKYEGLLKAKFKVIPRKYVPPFA